MLYRLLYIGVTITATTFTTAFSIVIHMSCNPYVISTYIYLYIKFHKLNQPPEESWQLYKVLFLKVYIYIYLYIKSFQKKFTISN